MLISLASTVMTVTGMIRTVMTAGSDNYAGRLHCPTVPCDKRSRVPASKNPVSWAFVTSAVVTFVPTFGMEGPVHTRYGVLRCTAHFLVITQIIKMYPQPNSDSLALFRNPPSDQFSSDFWLLGFSTAF